MVQLLVAIADFIAVAKVSFKMLLLIEPGNMTKPLLHGWRPSGLPSLPPEPDIPAGKPSVSRARSAPILIIPQWRCPVSSYRRECSQRTLLDEMNGG
jgi:hypothetical protein